MYRPREAEIGVVDFFFHCAPAEDTNQYGQDRRDGRDLAVLMRELGKLEGLHWMRIL